MHTPLSLSSLLTATDPTSGEVRVQCLTAETKQTKGGKPYFEISISDGGTNAILRVWSDHPAFKFAEGMQSGECYALTGTWLNGDFGLDSKDWSGRLLEGDDKSAVFLGPPELQKKQQCDWEALLRIVNDLPDGSLKFLSTTLLTDHEDRYRRSAAARGVHHARRGGLVEHVSLMAQSAVALCSVYPELRRDLLVAGVVFHDCGKMVENQFEAEGFTMPFSFRAEAYGHIAIGMQLAHILWKKLPAEIQERDRILLDALSHLILSHHGQLEWGSPVEPKLPEAAALHYIDNLDAKLEMMRAAKLTSKRLASGVIERVRPFGHNLLELPESDHS